MKVRVPASFEHVSENINYLSNRYGSYTFPTVTSFALDYSGNTAGTKDYSAYSQAFGNPLVNYTLKDLGLYPLRINGSVTPRLTLTLGALRATPFTPGPAIVNPAFP